MSQDKALDLVTNTGVPFVAPINYVFVKTQQLGNSPKLEDGTVVNFTQRYLSMANLWEDCGRFETEDASLAKKIREYAFKNPWEHIYEFTKTNP